MKRINNLYQTICSLDNLRAADYLARKGKSKQYGVRAFDLDPEKKLLILQRSLLNKTYRTSEYSVFTVFEPKERQVYRLPYFPDRIAHHAIMNVLEPVFMSMFTADTYSCIKGRGIHGAANGVKRALKDKQRTIYCLKLDITKFYPSVDHRILKQQLERKFKDKDLLWLLGEIIDSAPGLPIGNYLSQYLANFYLTGFDHWLKETMRVRYYFRYADDLVILAGNKPYLHALFHKMQDYLNNRLNLQIKGNYQVFPVNARSIDFVGYRFYHTHTLLRKSIKQKFARKVARGASRESIASYVGWASHCNSHHLLNKLLKRDARAISGAINMKYTLTIEAEDPAELSAVVNAFSGLGAPVSKPAAKKTTKKTDPTPDEEEETGGSEETMTVEAFRLKLKGYYGDDAKKKAKVKALLEEFGVPAAADVPKEKFGEFLNQLGIQ